MDPQPQPLDQQKMGSSLISLPLSPCLTNFVFNSEGGFLWLPLIRPLTFIPNPDRTAKAVDVPPGNTLSD